MTTEVDFTKAIYTSYSTVNKDTCISLASNCNGVKTYTGPTGAIGYISPNEFTGGTPIYTTFDIATRDTCLSTTPNCGKTPGPTGGTFISTLDRNECYSTGQTGNIYYIRADGSACYVTGPTGPTGPTSIRTTLCKSKTNTTNSLSAITGGATNTTPGFPVCVAADGTTSYLGNIALSPFDGGIAIHTSFSTADNDNCGSTGINCNSQIGYATDKVIGYAAASSGTYDLGATGTRPPPSTSIWNKWWFWTIIGGVVLLIIIIIIILVAGGKKNDDDDDNSKDLELQLLMSKLGNN